MIHNWSRVIFQIEILFQWCFWPHLYHTGWLARNSKKSRHAERCPASDWVHVHPKGHPGDDDNQDGGNVGLDHVETERSLQIQLSKEAGIVAWNFGNWEYNMIIWHSQRHKSIINCDGALMISVGMVNVYVHGKMRPPRHAVSFSLLSPPLHIIP